MTHRPLRSLTVALVLLAAYELSVRTFLPKVPLHEVPRQWQRDNIRARDLLDGSISRNVPCVIAGSSLVLRLDAETIVAGGRVLGLSGRSAMVGVELLVLSQISPQLVLVELNHLQRPVDPGFADEVLRARGQGLVALSLDRRPGLVLTRRLRFLYYWLRDKLAPALTPAPARDAVRSGTVPDEAKQDALAHELKVNQDPDDPDLLESHWRQLAAHTRILRDRGSRVILMEVPQHPDVRQSPRLRAMRQFCVERARAMGLPVLIPPLDRTFETTDGTHLAPAGAKAFSIWLRQALHQLPAR